MNMIEAIKQGRAVKHYDPEFIMPQDEINQLMSLAKLAPTAFNQQNTRFVIVSDPHCGNKSVLPCTIRPR